MSTVNCHTMHCNDYKDNDNGEDDEDKTKNRIRVTSLEFWIPLMHSFSIMYDTWGEKWTVWP